MAKDRSPAELHRFFQPQRSDDDCLPAALKGALDEHADRQGIRGGLGVSYGQLTKLCGYRRHLGSNPNGALIKRALDERLAKRKHACQFEFGPRVDMKLLEEVLASDDASYPVVGVSGKWFQEEALRKQAVGPPGGWDHALVVVSLAQEAVVVFDPMQRYLYPKSKPEELLLTVPLVRFQGYWAGAFQPRWTLWFQRTEKRTKAKTLEEFGGS